MQRPWPSRLAWASRYLAATAAFCWLVGLALTDRFHWSQFIWWIPHPVLAGLALPAATIALMQPDRGTRSSFLRRCGRWSWCLPCLSMVVGICLRDVGFRRWNPHADGLQLVQWNASWPGSLGGADAAERLLELEPDIAVISNPYKLFADGRGEAWQAAGYDVINLGWFLVASRLPVTEARVVTSAKGRIAALVRTVWRGEPLTVMPIDLPSEAWASRSDIAERLRDDLAGMPLGDVDIIVGDANIPRGSASLGVAFPDHRSAWNDAGRGYGGSWPRIIPLLQIDHVLIGPAIRATQVRFLDLGSRVHRAQHVTLRRDDSQD
ncbi:MAG: hypothetical protein JNL80_04665 [Phycisphaerae bacterium]|nr:hypothetical protein [Phycisphaerae bacterium]